MNDSSAASIPNVRLLRIALVLNVVLALGTAVSAALALWRPELLLDGAPIGAGTAFYAAAYAVRAIPLGAAIAFLAATGRLRPLAPLLLIGAAAQLGDLAIAAAVQNPGMAVGSALCAAGHLFGWRVLR
ncbi:MULTISPECIES: hypothetical protein [Glycomyces]|uniref:Uncharacterized protein n=2 Tax=Glycomyces TaxID=58113 RepID=A0A9X3T798_9ACTN|nr:hypothetical protein [Glycomyces lechevalierae]MDA1383983.1 hypothetical protein [Glycomyces lechevalierae]MDR7341023.1 hypothetical protein [Glycomyces lechevalierae]